MQGGIIADHIIANLCDAVCDDDIAYSAVSSPALTTMRIPTALIGRMAVRTLESAMADSELKGCKVLIGGTLVERASTAPCAAGPQRGGAA